ncbi:hypothetical protein DL93DRAFT_2160384 [Clavulina sp. PMI_390]|nr:hypothetical protein DL93DRAFT_2160384 [Clavulina sp. PMI_390]
MSHAGDLREDRIATPATQKLYSVGTFKAVFHPRGSRGTRGDRAPTLEIYRIRIVGVCRSLGLFGNEEGKSEIALPRFSETRRKLSNGGDPDIQVAGCGCRKREMDLPNQVVHGNLELNPLGTDPILSDNPLIGAKLLGDLNGTRGSITLHQLFLTCRRLLEHMPDGHRRSSEQAEDLRNSRKWCHCTSAQGPWRSHTDPMSTASAACEKCASTAKSPGPSGGCGDERRGPVQAQKPSGVRSGRLTQLRAKTSVIDGNQGSHLLSAKSGASDLREGLCRRLLARKTPIRGGKLQTGMDQEADRDAGGGTGE